jgi:hypothetical protein
MDCRQAGPYIDPSIISRMVRCLRRPPISLTSRGLLASSSGKQGHSHGRREGVDGALRRGGGASVSCPSTTHRSDRGAVAQRPLFDDTHDADDPWRRCSQGARIMRAIQRPAGSKNDARAHSAHALGPTWHPPWPVFGFCNYLMLQPGSHYPKVC